MGGWGTDEGVIVSDRDVVGLGVGGVDGRGDFVLEVVVDLRILQLWSARWVGEAFELYGGVGVGWGGCYSAGEAVELGVGVSPGPEDGSVWSREGVPEWATCSSYGWLVVGLRPCLDG